MEKPKEALEQALDELHSSLPELLANAVVTSLEGVAPFLPNKKRITQEIETEISTLKIQCQHGFDHIINAIQNENKERSQELKAFLLERFHSLASPPHFTQAVLKVIAGHSWREALKISLETLETLYLGARTIFEEGRFTDAIEAFTFLSWLESKQYDFWLSLGHSHFHAAHHEKAIHAYQAATHTIPDEAWPHVYSALCFEALGNREEAKICLTEGLEKAKKLSDTELIRALKQKFDEYGQDPIIPIS